MDRSPGAGALLACVAFALLVLFALAINVARLGSAISREVQRVQIEYLQRMGAGEASETNALLLGHCLRAEMLKSARGGFVHPDSWAATARADALPGCAGGLPPIASGRPPLIGAARARPMPMAAPPSATAPTSARAAYARTPGDRAEAASR